MLDKLKSILPKKEEETTIFPLNPALKIDKGGSHDVEVPKSYFPDSIPNDLVSDEILLNKLANKIINNNFFIQMVSTATESLLLKTLENRYDFIPTDKLKKSIEENHNELNRINSALADKTNKLVLVEEKISEALQNMAPKIHKMLSEVAQTVLHDKSTKANISNE